MKKRKLYFGKKEKEILRIVATGVLLGASFVAPNILTLAKYLNEDDKRKIKRSLKQLEDKAVIRLSGEEIILTAKGKEMSDRISREELVIAGGEWDGIWRVVAYDIPNTLTKERNYFREYLQRLGFVKIQKSMWVVPWECKEEVAVVAQSLRLSPHVMYLSTNYLPQQNSLLKRFNLDSE